MYAGVYTKQQVMTSLNLNWMRTIWFSKATVYQTSWKSIHPEQSYYMHKIIQGMCNKFLDWISSLLYLEQNDKTWHIPCYVHLISGKQKHEFQQFIVFTVITLSMLQISYLSCSEVLAPLVWIWPFPHISHTCDYSFNQPISPKRKTQTQTLWFKLLQCLPLQMDQI